MNEKKSLSILGPVLDQPYGDPTELNTFRLASRIQRSSGYTMDRVSDGTITEQF